MMINTIKVLHDRLDSINNHLEVLKRIDVILKQHKIIIDEDIKYIQSQQTKEKIFNYRANIISLYGALEFFIEEVFKEYIENLRVIIPKYTSLNTKIKGSYFSNVAKLHEKINYAKFSHITERQIAQNIERVIVQDKNEIIAESFFGNGGNYKHDVICGLFQSIGISNINYNITRLPPLFNLLSDSTQDNEQQRKKVQMRIDELVERRNEVAHGVTTDDIIDIDSFEDILKFIAAYCNSLNELLEHELLAYKWEQLSSNIYTPIKIYNDCIAELKVNNIHLSVGNKVIIKKKRFPSYIEVKIIEIRVKDNATGNIDKKESIHINEEHLISIQLSTNLKQNNELKFV